MIHTQLSVLFHQCFIWAFCIICPAEVIVQFSVYIISYIKTVKALGLLNHINRLSQLHQCDHEMLANRFSWKFIEELTLATLFLQEIYLATFLAFLPQTMQPRNSSGKDQRNNKPHQKCWFIGFLKCYTNLTKEGKVSQLHAVQTVSILWTLCHAHKGMQLVKVTQPYSV